MSDLETIAARYRADSRSGEELLALALSSDKENEEGFWESVRILQHRMAAIFPRLQILARSSEAKTRELAAIIIGQNGAAKKEMPQECVQVLSFMLHVPEENPRPLAAAILALGHLRSPEGPELIISYAQHPSADVRDAVAFSLGGHEEPAAVRALITLSRDADRDVRNWATFGLGTLLDADTPEIRDALAARLAETDEEIQGETLVGLVKRGDARAIPLLQEARARGQTSLLIRECFDSLLESKDRLPSEWRQAFPFLAA